jgi:GNAT superfamily N-acetyltransferase
MLDAVSDPDPVRKAETEADFESAGALLHEFNRVYDYPSPGGEFYGRRIEELAGDDLAAFLASDAGSDVGLTVVRVRPNLYSEALEAYLAELYVREQHRRRGLGSALLGATIAYVRERGCDRVELGTDEDDTDAHRLYRAHGFTNFTNPDAAPEQRERMFFYELELEP